MDGGCSAQFNGGNVTTDPCLGLALNGARTRTAVSWQARCKKDVEISTKQASPRIAWSTTRTRSSDERERGRRCKQYLADLPLSLITSNSLNRSLGHSQRHDIWQNLLVE
ncbi:hypothetical protein D6D17_07824 [Aureobasidium pullulans]|uniref:Uncharacterized protein n=1 Tax=Aureobasidium pullulans TaxID=5580 RepID=A0A4S8XGE3_AURPU|nr:hypothetical protein D6D24_04670 [Aureobasidium pullulans]THW39042.1 hypothetical protein D6D22_06473 [Aureobasidium pullulans]THW94539.1 hypothetical protein D6D17_07824 [Aureobasidium pullulans]THY52075.1 hypothetical protein D6C98_05420 [Aureobasidium pullulans]